MYWLGHPSLPLGSVVASYSTTVLIGNPVALRDETTAAASIELDLVCVGVGVGVGVGTGVGVGEHLRHRYHEPWSELEFAVDSGEVFWRDPGANVWLASKPFDQSVMLFRIAQISADVQRQLVKLQARDQDQVGKITRNRFVGNNQYVIAGTRVPTEIIWELRPLATAGEADIQ